MQVYRFLVVLALAATAGAQAPKPITFNDAIGIALRQNVAVRQAQNSAALGSASVQQARQQFLPDLRLNVSGANTVGRNFNQTEGTIINQQTQSLNTGVSSSVTLFDGLKNVSTLHSAQASEDAATSDLQRARQTAVFTVAQDFVALTNAREQLRVQQENLAAQQAQEKQIQAYVDAGVRPISDLYQQKAAVAGAQLSVTQATRTVELGKVDLIQALQLDPAGDYDFVAPVIATSIDAKTYNLDSLVARAYAKRADLSAQSSRLTAAAQDAKAAAAAKLPTVSLSGSYNTAYNSASVLAFGDQLDQRRGGSLSLGVSIPMFDRGSASIAEQRAQIQAENAQLALANQRQTVAIEVRRAYLDQKSAREQLAAAEAQLAAAQQAVEATQKRYQAGAATLVELTQTRAQQVQAASAVIGAKYNVVLQQAVMSYYTGDLDPARVSLGG
jgi:outer membrane protein